MLPLFKFELLLVVFIGFLFTATLWSQSARSDGEISKLARWLQMHRVQIELRWTQYAPEFFNEKVVFKRFNLLAGNQTIDFLASQWQIRTEIKYSKQSMDAWDLQIACECLAGRIENASITVDLIFADWSAQNYVLMPGAAYNGNRTEARAIPYPPFLADYRDLRPDIPQIISDVPRLNPGAGPSQIQDRTGSLSTPAIGFYAPQQKHVCWLLTEQRNQYGDLGLSIEENRDRTQAIISITSPLVREKYRYFMCTTQYPSTDTPATFNVHDSLSLKFRLGFAPAENLQALFNYFGDCRKELMPRGNSAPCFPFSNVWEILEAKFNRLNYEPAAGYYSIGFRENLHQDWQIGWVGGMQSTFPLLMLGTDSTHQNVLRNFDWLFPQGISPSGLFWDTGHRGEWMGIFPYMPQAKDLHLIRKSGDGLYYVLKQLFLMEKMGIPVKDNWRNGALTVATAFAKIWHEQGQLGQFVDNRTGKIIIGGSASGAIVPAALALAAQYFHRPDFLETAQAMGRYFDEKFLKPGLIYGGVGEALQNCDSEAGYALVESFTILYELTGDSIWMTRAKDAARQFTTWVIAYDFQWPDCLFGRLGIKTTGAVIANTQNRHGAPGICTHSGVGLLKIFRATQDWFCLELLQDIAHNLPQYLSHPDRLIPGLQAGWINERVNITDFLEGIGEIFPGSTWAETSMMLTIAEIPGLYVLPDLATWVVFDQIEVTQSNQSADSLELTITSPTHYPARVTILAENSSQRKKPLGVIGLWDANTVTLAAGQSQKLSFARTE
ncbi:hypothetical protein L0128_19805 [candidate division KSB1 bacterium]|nr:hypothetical protein [candidate division KSB1 bacterium]